MNTYNMNNSLHIRLNTRKSEAKMNTNTIAASVILLLLLVLYYYCCKTKQCVCMCVKINPRSEAKMNKMENNFLFYFQNLSERGAVSFWGSE